MVFFLDNFQGTRDDTFQGMFEFVRHDISLPKFGFNARDTTCDSVVDARQFRQLARRFQRRRLVLAQDERALTSRIRIDTIRCRCGSKGRLSDETADAHGGGRASAAVQPSCALAQQSCRRSYSFVLNGQVLDERLHR